MISQCYLIAWAGPWSPMLTEGVFFTISLRTYIIGSGHISTCRHSILLLSMIVKRRLQIETVTRVDMHTMSINASMHCMG